MVASPGVAQARNCGDVQRGERTAYNIRADQGCAQARQLVARYLRRSVVYQIDRRIIHSGQRYRCYWRQARCGKVRWQWDGGWRWTMASWYGPGLFGGPLACGGRLSPGTVGVAHKTLPCGTLLQLRLRGRSVYAPVIDRGPYVAGRELDLAQATAYALGFSGVGQVQMRVATRRRGR